ncbi:hypothetical protein [Streptomyces sp. BPTC-684]|uniref:hypothetical protein n=1 Tax=Streptomyces sp. BPTC-684 TaxID=3043734 RepID=UPI0024B1FCAD|nr:hypothetical protein [Streptomyces sp. BPTC-684]WHM41131.1 hypothetical protein QIY60_32590 [Streptomyces sp. BPTC-684]
MIHLPVWALLGLVIVLCIMFRAVRAWIVIVAVALGLYVAQTQFGQEAKRGGDQVVNNVNERQK